MNYHRRSLSRATAAFRTISSLLVALACGVILAYDANPALATGSVTIHLYACPASVSLAAVHAATSPGPILDACEPFDGASEALRLRAMYSGKSLAGESPAPGVLFWPFLEFGGYRLDGHIPIGTRDLLYMTADGVPSDEPDPARLTIGSGKVEIERRLYVFPPEVDPTGSTIDASTDVARG